ncbi:hypothetical protein PHLGIDRAFT_341875 [Phlebiopsis gigantea 11061_1 CR5-6]|uniref:Uncharacterized protein n=1 Tax=Phlebiopsis gigantea (strain 11061_1 CR5-6) TaxID=745531 RepID=A0A0C3S247_PHLG1|nr:hypothetical protein PHLGIDRAFT_341875 [Phlebiopsis gigantea 11061_1 CR5-6]
MMTRINAKEIAVYWMNTSVTAYKYIHQHARSRSPRCSIFRGPAECIRSGDTFSQVRGLTRGLTMGRGTMAHRDSRAAGRPISSARVDPESFRGCLARAPRGGGSGTRQRASTGGRDQRASARDVVQRVCTDVTRSREGT